MPYKDPAKKRQRDAEYHQENREKRLAQMRDYNSKNAEEISENKTRRLRVSGMYMGSIGMTRKQRQEFIERINNGTIK